MKPPEYDRSDNLFFAVLFSYLLFGMVFATFARVYFFPGAVFIGFILIVGMLILLVALVFKIAVPKWKWSFQKIFKLRNLVQELINNAIEFFREEGLDPVEYPLKLSSFIRTFEEEKISIIFFSVFYMDFYHNFRIDNSFNFINDIF